MEDNFALNRVIITSNSCEPHVSHSFHCITEPVCWRIFLKGHTYLHIRHGLVFHKILPNLCKWRMCVFDFKLVSVRLDTGSFITGWIHFSPKMFYKALKVLFCLNCGSRVVACNIMTGSNSFLAAMSSSSSDNVTQSVRPSVRVCFRPWVRPGPFFGVFVH